MLFVQAVVTARQQMENCSRETAENKFDRGVTYAQEELDAQSQAMYVTCVNW